MGGHLAELWQHWTIYYLNNKILSLLSVYLILHPHHHHRVSSAAISPLINPSSIFQSNYTTSNDTLSAASDQFHCAGDRPWTASYKPKDCLYALAFLQKTATRYGDEPFSWPAIAVRGNKKLESVNTPLRYRWRMSKAPLAKTRTFFSPSMRLYVESIQHLRPSSFLFEDGPKTDIPFPCFSVDRNVHPHHSSPSRRWSSRRCPVAALRPVGSHELSGSL